MKQKKVNQNYLGKYLLETTPGNWLRVEVGGCEGVNFLQMNQFLERMRLRSNIGFCSSRIKAQDGGRRGKIQQVWGKLNLAFHLDLKINLGVLFFFSPCLIWKDLGLRNLL